MKIAIIDPVSSGKCLIQAFEDLGAEVVQVFEPSLAPQGSIGYISEDINMTADFLKSQQVEAIVNGSEFGIHFTDQLTEIMNLPGNDNGLSYARTDKYEMIRVLESKNIRVPQTKIITCEKELMDYLNTSPSFPIFIKPTSSAGSDNCKRCDTKEDVITGFRKIFHEKNILGKMNKSVILQEYIDGEQYILNTVSSNGSHFITEIYKVHIEQIDNTPIYRDITTIDHCVYSSLIDSLSHYVLECLDCIGIKNGAAHTELRMTEKGPLLIEINSRVMGPILDINAFSFGFGYSQASILAESILFPNSFNKRLSHSVVQPKNYFSMVFLRCPFQGRIKNRIGLSTIRRLPGFHSVVQIPSLGYVAENPLLTTGDFGIAYFSHADKEVLDYSLSILHQLENEGKLYEVTCD